jgi:hypothetical protein
LIIKQVDDYKDIVAWGTGRVLSHQKGNVGRYVREFSKNGIVKIVFPLVVKVIFFRDPQDPKKQIYKNDIIEAALYLRESNRAMYELARTIRANELVEFTGVMKSYQETDDDGNMIIREELRMESYTLPERIAVYMLGNRPTKNEIKDTVEFRKARKNRNKTEKKDDYDF